MKVSEYDNQIYLKIRENIRKTLETIHKDGVQGRILDVAPQVHGDVSKIFSDYQVDSLDIDPEANATYTVDLCQNNAEIIPSGTYDLIFCFEVLEHTLQPFDAMNELYRILKPNGRLVLSTPYDFRIHGPLPDCWRFTEHGLKVLAKDFSLVEINSLENPDRFLMPWQYVTIATK